MSLGMPLKEIAVITSELLSEGLSPEREIGIIDTQVARLEQKAAELAKPLDRMHAKRNWMARGKPGDEPRFSGEDLCLTEIATPASSRATFMASEEDQGA
ncbi:MerR family transcriptional regulator [Agrobacterium tumefaciens]|nr:MerR family transcriptional regulator [Agrobacterium tumefaciens]